LRIPPRPRSVRWRVNIIQADGRLNNNIRIRFTYLEVGTACGEDDFVGLEIFPFRGKRAVDQRTTFEECIEILYERALMVVPPEAKLLVVLHGTCDFVPSFLHRRKNKWSCRWTNQQSLRTDVEPDNDVRFSFPVSLPVSTWLIDQLTDPTLSHPSATYYYTRAHRARRGTRESTRFEISFQPNSLPSFSLPPFLPLFRTLLSREDDESSATKRRSFQNGRVQCKRVGQIVLLALPLCVSRNGNGLPGGDDAGGRASTAHAQLRYPGCAHSLRNNREGLWDSGATFMYTYY